MVLATTYGSVCRRRDLHGLTLAGKCNRLFAFFDNGPIDPALYFNGISFFVSGLVIATLKDLPRGPAASSGEYAGHPLKVVLDGSKYVGQTSVVRGLVIGIIGAFSAGGVVIGLARTFVGVLGGGSPGYGVLFGRCSWASGSGCGSAPGCCRVSRGDGCGLSPGRAAAVPLALVQQLEIVTAITLVLGFFAGVAWIPANTLLGWRCPTRSAGAPSRSSARSSGSRSPWCSPPRR